LLIIEVLIFIVLETFLTALIIRILRIKVKPGEYELSIKNKEFFKHLLFFTLYRPSLKLISIIPLVPLRLKFLKIIGLKIGKNSIIAGTELIDEPFSVSIGENTVIGGMSIIFTHYSFKKMIHKPVVIGNNCFIGNKSVVMPGSIIEDNVILEPNSVVKTDQILKKNRIYSGNPAEEKKRIKGGLKKNK
jgi:acetyltransferase-like isoleucine patch superfamily enzyme